MLAALQGPLFPSAGSEKAWCLVAKLLLFFAEPIGGSIYGTNDTLLPRTPAKIPGDRLDNLISLRLRIFLQQVAGAH